MGLAFGLSRDEELEKTRLDLERARMEREDFRQGGGPNTALMHSKRSAKYEDLYKESLMQPTDRSSRSHQAWLSNELDEATRAQSRMYNDQHRAARALKRLRTSVDEATASALEALSIDYSFDDDDDDTEVEHED